MAKWTAIKVKVPKNKKYFNKLLGDELERIMEEPKKELENYVRPFRVKNRPVIKKIRKDKPEKISVFVGVTSSWSSGKKANKNDKFMFNARGTSKRYATMPGTFTAKTSPNSLSSKAVRGNRDPLYVSRDLPKPGIEARNTEQLLKRKFEKKIKTKMVLSFGKLAIKSGFGLI